MLKAKQAGFNFTTLIFLLGIFIIVALIANKNMMSQAESHSNFMTAKDIETISKAYDQYFSASCNGAFVQPTVASLINDGYLLPLDNIQVNATAISLDTSTSGTGLLYLTVQTTFNTNKDATEALQLIGGRILADTRTLIVFRIPTINKTSSANYNYFENVRCNI